MYQGFYVFGVCIGVVSEPWNRNGRSGVNNRLGVEKVYQDKYGREVRDLIEIDLPATEVERFRNAAQQMKGKPVFLRVQPMPKAGGRNGAFMTYFAPSDSQLVLQSALVGTAEK